MGPAILSLVERLSPLSTWCVWKVVLSREVCPLSECPNSLYKCMMFREGASAAAAGSEMDSDLPVEYLRSSLAQESQVPSSTPSGGGGGGSEQQLQEEDDLQLAIAMSLNEQENKAKKTSSSASVGHRHHAPSSASSRSDTPSAPPPAPSTLYASIMHDTGPEPSSVSYAQEPLPPQQPPPPPPEPSADPVSLMTLYQKHLHDFKFLFLACSVPR